MSLFDDASLVLIPDGAKDGKLYSVKPTDGTGDFTFTRGSNLAATRVDENGLIEKGRENFLTHSNAFNNWTIDDVTRTSGQSGYDGSNNAWLIQYNTTASRHNINRTVTPNFSEIGTASIYAKAKELQYIQLAFVNTTNQYANFDLSDGSIGDVGSDFFGAKAESVGNGWYRLSVVDTRTSNTLYISIISSKTAGWLESFSGANNTDGLYIQDAQVELGLVATDYIETTTTTAVSGITEDLPRIDYSGGASCPSLLLEPQRTNLFLQSEYFNGWGITDASLTDNSVNSPEGLQNATTLTEDVTNQRHRIYYSVNVTNGTTYTSSVFVKKNSSGRFLLINANTAFNARAVLNLDTLEVTNINGTEAKVEDYGNGWYRFSISGQASTSSSVPVFIQIQNAASDVPYLGDGSSLYLYGAQAEVGSYPTSYIPTYGTSVTRVADATIKSTISDLIGQTEGTIFIEFDAEEDAPQNMNLINFNNSTQASVLIAKRTSGELRAQVFAGGSAPVDINSAIVSGKTKAAIAYKSGDSILYVNGVGVSDSSTFTFNGTLSEVIFPSHQAYFNYGHKYSVNQALLFKTRLSNTELAALTTI